MNILLLDDHQAEELDVKKLDVNRTLKPKLQEDGHLVWSVNGLGDVDGYPGRPSALRRFVNQIIAGSPGGEGPEMSEGQLADVIEEIMADRGIGGVVLDLQWFGDLQYGVRLLDELGNRIGAPLAEGSLIVVWSNFTNENDNYKDLLRLCVRPDHIFKRTSNTWDQIVRVFHGK